MQQVQLRSGVPLALCLLLLGARAGFNTALAASGDNSSASVEATVTGHVDDVVYDAAADLLADETRPGTPNGTNDVWVYGGYDPALSRFTPFTSAQHLDNWPPTLQSGTFQGYASLAGDYTPALVVNTNLVVAQSPCCGITPIGPGKILIHPSSPGGGNFGDAYDVPVLRWTSPAEGTVALRANFLQRHSNPQRGYVLTNGHIAVTGLAASGGGKTLSVTGLVVTIGDVIDIGVAPGPGGYGAGSTEVGADISFTELVRGPVVILMEPADQSVEEAAPAVFRVQVDQKLVGYQWQRDSNNIPGAIGAAYTVTNSLLTDSGAFFRCVISNSVSTNLTRNALLTVLPDLTPPTILSVANVGLPSLVVVFSEPVEPLSATNPFNYALDRGLVVSSASFWGDERSILLSVSPLTLDLPFALTVNHVRDRATAANVIAANSQVIFTPRRLLSQEIGRPTPPGAVTGDGGSYAIVAGGGDIGGTNDQCQSSQEVRTGNFDVKVRLESLAFSDPWAKAGLMARETTNAGSPFAAALATPTSAGSFFVARATLGGTTFPAGHFPVNYPFTWLRLRRAGNLFSGFASLDGENWALLGSATLALSNTLYFGLAVTSHNTNQTTTAQFRDLAAVAEAGSSLDSIALPFEPLAPSSRRTGLVISEIMYHPIERTDGRDLEFVELFNTLPYYEDLGGYRLAGDVEFEFPPGTTLAAGAFLVLAKRPADIEAGYGLSGVAGPYTGSLPNGSGTVRLLNASGAVLLEVNYGSRSPWPRAADGAGHSLVLARPSFGERDPAAWAASEWMGGSPGALEVIRPEPLRGVKINEFLANSASPDVDYIELYNHGNLPVDLSGSFLSDAAANRKFKIPAGTVMDPRGFVAFDQNQLGFALSAAGESIFLVNSNQTRVIDAVGFEGQAQGISTGRSPDGAPGFRALSAQTPGTNNAPALVRDVVINEIMYHPLSGNDDDEYIELMNRGTNPVSLGGWAFTAGINFTFPTNAIIPGRGFLVAAKNLTNLLARYPNLSPANAVGNYSGVLADGGERVALSMPEPSGNPGGAIPMNAVWIVADEVTYGTGGRWGRWADGGGSSLELIDASSDHRLPSNWADSDESSKTTNWTRIEHTGVLDNGSIDHPATGVQVLLLGAGECLVDNVEVLKDGVNLVANGTFESGAGGWLFEGTHDASSAEAGAGFESNGSLHLRASAHGGPVVDRVRTLLTSTLPAGATSTIRAQVRWLRGHPEALVRLRGNWLEAIGSLHVPSNLGTPGAPNSRAVLNAGPAIFGVSHHPVLPTPDQPVLVTARVSDPDGVDAVQLGYRVDPAAEVFTVPMLDDGTGGDELAGDGVYSALIPGQEMGAMVAFQVHASDRSALKATTGFPADAPARECLVRFGEIQPFGNLGSYRLWMTAATLQHWASREKNSNQPLDCTFVNGNQRVIYNMGAYYSGSPFKTPAFDSPIGAGCDYNLHFPDDDRFLGATDFEISTPGNNPGSPEPTALNEQLSYWIARQLGLPFMERRFIHLFVNGVKRGTIMEDTQLPNADVIEEWFPEDNNGELFKTSFSFEIDEVTPGPATWIPASLRIFNTTGGVKKTARYRWNWQPRAAHGSANNYADLFALVDVLNGPVAGYNEAVESFVDVEQWMRFFAYEHIVGQWDSLGYNTGSNVYPYKGKKCRWTLFPWDVDISFIADGPTTDLFAAVDPPLARMNSYPVFRRAYWRALKDAVVGPLANADVAPVAMARHAALRANGLDVTPPDAALSYISQRRAYILQQMATLGVNFSVNGPVSFSTNQNVVTLTGLAPIELKTVLATVNGVNYPASWVTVSSWAIRLALLPGTNQVFIQAFDRFDNPLPDLSRRITIDFTGQSPNPQEGIVINEIMHSPAVPGASYIELFNRAPNRTYDLSNWHLPELGVFLPEGTLLSAGGFLVLARNRAGFFSAYPSNTSGVKAEFPVDLNPRGQTVTLVRPGVLSAAGVLIDQAYYEAVTPWPNVANPPDTALQRIDPSQDARRVSNWSTGYDWRFMSVTGTVVDARLTLFLPSAGEVLLDDIQLVDGTVPAVGSNYVRNGDFEGPLTTNEGGPWVFVSPLVTNSVITREFVRSGEGALHLVFTGSGGPSANLYQDIDGLVPANVYTLSYWYLPNPKANQFTARLGSRLSKTLFNPSPILASPGASNVTARALPPYPSLWLNEVQPENLTGPTNAAGAHLPWIELYNADTNSLSLAGLFLANSYSNLTRWTFPDDARIDPGQFQVIFADGQPGQSTAAEWHTSFTLNPGSGSVALSRLLEGRTQILDYLNYVNLPPDSSYGDFPDGQPIKRQIFSRATAGTNNLGIGRMVYPVINEWMADNTRTLANAANGNAYDDWFELYNPGTNAFDLEGYYLTDALDNPRQFLIPPGYRIGPHGYLLVWADGSPLLNSPARPDLHVNFQLAKSGDGIGLFAPDASAVDLVTFGAQDTDVAEGRYPDGTERHWVLAIPSPRAANTAPHNRAPTLATRADEALYAGEKLTFVTVGTDLDFPPQSLRYSLDLAPPGAGIDPGSGMFSWTPASLPVPSTNLVRMRVTDDGLPNLSATSSFNVTVLPRPELTFVRAARPTLSFSVLSNRAFSLDWREGLEYGRWTKLRELPARPTNRMERILDANPLAAGRLYRLTTPPSPSPPAGPVILLSPHSLVADVGQDIELSVFALGAGTLKFEWRFNGIVMDGETTSNIVVKNVQLNASGAYQVTVSDQGGSIANQPPAMLALRPQILVQPESQVVVAGATVTFRVGAVGSDPLRYRWTHQGKILANEQLEILTLSNAQASDAGTYRASVSQQTPVGEVGLWSSPAVLTIR